MRPRPLWRNWFLAAGLVIVGAVLNLGWVEPLPINYAAFAIACFVAVFIIVRLGWVRA